MSADHDRLQVAAHKHLLLQFALNGAFGEEGRELPVMERGDGPYLWDTRGRRYLDGLSSLYCAQLGYSYGREMGEVALAQMERLAFNTNYTTAHPSAIALAERLAELAPGDLNKAFFVNGGSEAVESAWKIAREFHTANGQPERTKAIARHAAYHGVTLGALALTGIPEVKDRYGPPAIDVRHVSNTLAFRSPEGQDSATLCRRLLREVEEAVLEEGPEQVAMIIAEPVQNPGGCLLPPPGYWPGLREICDRFGILLVADEVICGFGRLGEWFGGTRFDAMPDMIAIAKGLSSAHVPIGAVLVSERIAAPLFRSGHKLQHGFTWGGNPLCTAVALHNLTVLERDGVLQNVRALEHHLGERMRALLELPLVGDVRGAGFFWAAELVADAGGGRFSAPERERLIRDMLVPRFHEAGVLLRLEDRGGDPIVQIAPPLICDRAVLDELVDAIATVLADVDVSAVRSGEHAAAI